MRFCSNNHKSGSWDLGGGEPAALDYDCFLQNLESQRSFLCLEGKKENTPFLIYWKIYQMLSSRPVPKRKKAVILRAALAC